MQESGLNNQNGIENCVDAVNHRLISLEARLMGPLPGLTPNSPPTQKSQCSDQTTIEKYLDCNSQKSQKSFSLGTPAAKVFSTETSAQNSPGEVKKRTRARDDDLARSDKKKGNFSGTKRRQIEDAAADSDYSLNTVIETPSVLADVSDLFKTDISSDFMMSSLVNTLNQKIAKLQHEMRLMEAAQAETEKKLAARDTTIESLRHQLEKKDEEAKAISEEHQSLLVSSEKGKNALIKSLRAYEEKKRQELKVKLFNDSFRLGKVITVRESSKFQEYWEDGKEITEVKSRIPIIAAQKEQLEKLKKSKKIDEDIAATLPLKLTLLNREETELKEKLERLEREKNVHIQECRRVAEEDSAKYSKETDDHEAWPVLHKRYLLLSLLGKGGYSEVYKAYDLQEHIYIAIKFHQLNPLWGEAIKANYIKHALRENHIHRELDHPRIVRHFDTLEIDNNCFCTVLEYCPGDDLHMYLKKHKTLTEKEAKSVMMQIFSGLKYLNEQKEIIIHYDLKPHNILLNNGNVKITDFGLSKIMEPSNANIELTSQGVGTYWYQAPECFQTGHLPPRISSKVDVWSAGVIFFELLYGQRPFGHNMAQEKVLKNQVIVNATSVDFPNKAGISNECKEFIRRCLEYDQDRRWDVIEAYSSPYFHGKK